MKKPFISMTLSTVLFASAIVAGAGQITPVQAADTKSDLEQSVEKDLKATAGYVMSQIKAKLQDSTYVPRYNDYTQTMLAVKAGVTDTDVTNALTAALKAEDSAVLNPQGEGTKSLSIAAAILYLNELGENPAEFNGQDLVTLLYNTFMTEMDMNPYTYQYVNAAALQSVKDVDKLTEILNKIHADVENDYYVDGESGCGIDYYGVSVDNNANVLSAWYLQDLLDSETELPATLKKLGLDTSKLEYEGVSEKIDAALDWTMDQRDESGAIVSWGSANPDSTALALRWTAEMGDLESAEGYYEALVQFKSETTEGVYTYAGTDNIYATVDALWGLVSYDRALNGFWLFDTTADCQEEETPEETTPEITTPETTTTEETTTGAAAQETTTGETIGQQGETTTGAGKNTEQASSDTKSADIVKTGDHAGNTAYLFAMTAGLAVMLLAGANISKGKKNEENR